MSSPTRRFCTPQLQTTKLLLEQGLQVVEVLERPPLAYSATRVCSAPLQEYGRLATLPLMLARSQQGARWRGRREKSEHCHTQVNT